MPAYTRRLIRPDIAYHHSYVTAASEFKADGHHRYREMDIEALDRNFATHVERVLALAEKPLQRIFVTETIFWLVEPEPREFLGRLSIRHRLTDTLREYGGHIGYEVRPSRRREGHGAEMLRQALPYAKALGIDQAMITCDEDNIGSRRIIEINGGVLQDVVQLPYRDVPTMRWWIDLSDFTPAEP